MIDVLNLPDTQVYEKAKKICRYFTEIPGVDKTECKKKNKKKQKNVLTLSIPNTSDLVPHIDYNNKKDLIAEILKHMPKRSRKKC